MSLKQNLKHSILRPIYKVVAWGFGGFQQERAFTQIEFLPEEKMELQKEVTERPSTVCIGSKKKYSSVFQGY